LFRISDFEFRIYFRTLHGCSKRLITQSNKSRKQSGAGPLNVREVPMIRLDSPMSDRGAAPPAQSVVPNSPVPLQRDLHGYAETLVHHFRAAWAGSGL